MSETVTARLAGVTDRLPAWAPDAILVAALAAAGLAGSGSGTEYHMTGTVRWVALGLLAPQTLPLLVRRRWPGTALVLVTAAMAGRIWAGLPPTLAGLSVLAAIYSVGLYATARTRWLAWVCTGAAFAATLVAFLLVGSYRVFLLLLPCVAFLSALLIGEHLRTRRALLASVSERADRLERDQEEQARQAVAVERARIARELHDLVAHHVSAVAVQAQAAQYTTDSGQVSKALRAIQTTSDQILTELRQMLGLLRDGDVALAPQPGLAELDTLLETARAAGLVVEVTTRGEPVALPDTLDLSAYRIVQEALTNVRRHAQATRVHVDVHYGHSQIELRVRDDGRGAMPDARPGRGLIGIRERVGLYGGTCHTGPAPGGGYQVCAVLPVHQEVSCPSAS